MSSYSSNTVQSYASILYKGRVWIRILSILFFIQSLFFAISIIGLVVAWIPAWAGLISWRIAHYTKVSYLYNNEMYYLKAQQQVKKYFIYITVLWISSILVLCFLFLVFYDSYHLFFYDFIDKSQDNLNKVVGI